MPFLDNKERDQLITQHKKERDGRIRDRIKAVLLRDKDWTWMQISEALLLSEEMLRKHLKDYENSKKLSPENGGSKEKLSIEQSKQLINHLENQTYLYTKDIVEYVRATFKISYSISGMCFWLKRHNFRYKKPSIVPGKINKDLQEKWVKEYTELKEKLPENETICFGDGVHPTHNVQLAYGWIRKGRRKEICSNTGRQRINITGAVDLIENKLYFQEDKTLNAKSTIDFFKNLEKAYPHKSGVHIFLDNARYYKNKEVKHYLKKSKIKVHFLPPYSPNLNPIERLWKWMKERVMYNSYYKEFDGFKHAVFGFLRTIANIDKSSALGKSFCSRINDNFHLIKSPIPNS